MSTDTTQSLATQSHSGTQGLLTVYGVIPILLKKTSSGDSAIPDHFSIEFRSDKGVEARTFPSIASTAEALTLVSLPVTIEQLSRSYENNEPVSIVVSPQYCDRGGWTTGDPYADPPGSVYVRALGSRTNSQCRGAKQHRLDPDLWVYKSKHALAPYVETTRTIANEYATRFDLHGSDKLPRGSLVACLTKDKCSLLGARGKTCKRTPKENIWDDWDPREAEGA